VSSRSSQGVAHAFKKLTWCERNALCMNVDICGKQYDCYVSNKHINDNLHALLMEIREMKSGHVPPTPSMPSFGTRSYGKWSNGLVGWTKSDDVSSHRAEPASVAEGRGQCS
jgi:hypothetical protein